MTIEITKFHKFESGALYGFLDIAVPLWGTKLNIKGCKVFNKNGKQWVTLPSREYQGDDGEKKYSNLIGIDDEQVFKKFSEAMNAAWSEYVAKQSQPEPEPEFVPRADGVPF